MLVSVYTLCHPSRIKQTRRVFNLSDDNFTVIRVLPFQMVLHNTLIYCNIEVLSHCQVLITLNSSNIQCYVVEQLLQEQTTYKYLEQKIFVDLLNHFVLLNSQISRRYEKIIDTSLQSKCFHQLKIFSIVMIFSVLSGRTIPKFFQTMRGIMFLFHPSLLA